MIEQWKQIGNTDYFVSNLSRIKSVKNAKERILKPFKSKNANAYYEVYLSNKGIVTRGYIHRLVAQAFIPNPSNKRDVNHKNGIKTDNKLENLEWSSHAENMQHARLTGLTPKRTYTKLSHLDIPVIKERYSSGKYFQWELARMFGVSVGTINGVVNNNHWN